MDIPNSTGTGAMPLLSKSQSCHWQIADLPKKDVAQQLKRKKKKQKERERDRDASVLVGKEGIVKLVGKLLDCPRGSALARLWTAQTSRTSESITRPSTAVGSTNEGREATAAADLVEEPPVAEASEPAAALVEVRA